MGLVIDFPARSPSEPAAKESGLAEVVIFPGVHVERREFNLADRVAKVGLRPVSASQAENLIKD